MKNIAYYLDYLYGLERRGIKIGLEHSFKLMEHLGNPQHSFQSIHVAGTNGKGSTCAHIASILKCAHYRVGLYTSPHLVNFNERIRVNGIPISDECIVEFISSTQKVLEKIEATFFEATTALALWYFDKTNVDVAVIETGLGGRLDSTNIIKSTQTIITQVAIDHSEILGNTIEKIAFEKGGIIKNNTPLLLADQKPAVKTILLKIANEKKAPVFTVKNFRLKITPKLDVSTYFHINGCTFWSPLQGNHQAKNAALSILSVNQFDPGISIETIQKGLSCVSWPGRLQKMDKKNPIFYDVAHNAHSITTILEMFQNNWSGKPVGIFALKSEKNINFISKSIQNSFSNLYVTTIPASNLLTTNILSQELIKNGIKCTIANDINSALAMMKEQVNKDKPGLIFGSHYIAKAVFNFFSFSFDKGTI